MPALCSTERADLAPQPTAREIFDRVESDMRSSPHQIELPIVHTFGPGFYARTIAAPADVKIMGKEHKTEHIFIVSVGDITLITERDGVIVETRVQAPFQMVCQPGTKRAGYTHAATICTNVHITTETDLAKLEADLITTPALPAPAPQETLS